MNTATATPTTISLGRARLHKALSVAKAFVPSRSVTPIIERVRLRKTGDSLYLHATNLGQSYMELVEQSNTFKDVPDFDLCVSHTLLFKLVGALSEEVQLAAAKQGAALYLGAGNFSTEIDALPGEEFPKMPPSEESAQVLTVPAADFAQRLQVASNFASRDDLKIAMNAVAVVRTGGGLDISATDAHRMFLDQLTGEQYGALAVDGASQTFLLPIQAATYLHTIVGKGADDEKVALRLTDSHLHVSWEDSTAAFRLIDAKYPDYINVVPQTHDTTVVLPKEELLESIKRLQLVANKTTYLGRFSFSASEGLTILSEDTEFANRAHESISALGYNGEDIKIGFNLIQMGSVLQCIPGDQVVIQLGSPNRSATLFSPLAPERILLLMPILLYSVYH